MSIVTLNTAEAVILHKILSGYAGDLSFMLGQDLSVDFEEGETDIVSLAAFTMNDEDFQPVNKEDNTFNLYSAVNHFLERLEVVR